MQHTSNPEQNAYAIAQGKRLFSWYNCVGCHANGGGGIPHVRRPDGSLAGVEAVIDKDLGAALLARTTGAEVLVIATDVPNAVIRWGEPDAEPLGRITVEELRAHAADGHFASGSMGPKVDAVCRFVEATGRRGVITSLDQIIAAVDGAAGTVVLPSSQNREEPVT